MCLVQPESSRSAAKQGETEKPMEDRSSFPGWGSGVLEDWRVRHSENGPKYLSSRCPCRLHSTQLQSAQTWTLSLQSYGEIWSKCALHLLLGVCLNWHKQYYNLNNTNTYICVLEDATVKPDTSSAAVQVLDSFSDKTSCFDGALSSAMEKKGRESFKPNTVRSNRDRDFLQTNQEINESLLMERQSLKIIL